jgi:chromosome segregation ATPase
MTQATIETAPPAPTESRVRELQDQLRRERSARVGVERGLEALSERLTELQRENRELRDRLGAKPA